MSSCSIVLPPITTLMKNIVQEPLIVLQPVKVEKAIVLKDVPKNNNQRRKCKFTPEEDCLLRALVCKFGVNNWNTVANHMISRNARQCRERWNNYLSPNIRADPWTHEEDMLLLAKYNEHGSHWSRIAKSFVNRSDNAVRNRWQMLVRQNIRRTTSESSNSSEE